MAEVACAQTCCVHDAVRRSTHQVACARRCWRLGARPSAATLAATPACGSMRSPWWSLWCARLSHHLSHLCLMHQHVFNSQTYLPLSAVMIHHLFSICTVWHSAAPEYLAPPKGNQCGFPPQVMSLWPFRSMILRAPGRGRSTGPSQPGSGELAPQYLFSFGDAEPLRRPLGMTNRLTGCAAPAFTRSLTATSEDACLS